MSSVVYSLRSPLIPNPGPHRQSQLNSMCLKTKLNGMSCGKETCGESEGMGRGIREGEGSRDQNVLHTYRKLSKNKFNSSFFFFFKESQMEVFTYLLKQVSKGILPGNVINPLCLKNTPKYVSLKCFYFVLFFVFEPGLTYSRLSVNSLCG